MKIDWDVIAPPRPAPPAWAQEEAERQAQEPLGDYLRRLHQEQN